MGCSCAAPKIKMRGGLCCIFNRNWPSTMEMDRSTVILLQRIHLDLHGVLFPDYVQH